MGGVRRYQNADGTKVASNHHAKKIFNKMIKEDPQFKASVEDMIKTNNAGVPVSKIAKQLGIPESEVYALTSDSKK